MKKFRRKSRDVLHDLMHFNSDAYDKIEKKDYEGAKRTLFKACNYIQREMMEDFKRGRKDDKL